MKKVLHSILTGICLISTSLSVVHAESKVKLMKTPNEGVQPKIIVDSSDNIHLIYYKGDAEAGDIYYTRKESGGDFIEPIRINSVSHSAIAMGTIRGAQFAVDRKQRVHVVWNGSGLTKQEWMHGPPMFYTRLKEDGSGFEEQRVITGHWPVDGGGAIGVDSSNRVFIFWHSGEEGTGEDNRSIFARISEDNGSSFDRETIISPDGAGVCGCCSMQAAVDRNDNVYVMYRTAGKGEHRDINLLLSTDRGKSFEDQIIDEWKLQACPMSSMSFGETDRYMLAGWETENQVRFAPMEKGSLMKLEIKFALEDDSKMKHPVFATSTNGEVLLVWAEGTGWKQGGTIAWQQYDSQINPVGKLHRPDAEVPMWSFLAAYYSPPEDTFYILH
jgi:hypothetical protein